MGGRGRERARAKERTDAKPNESIVRSIGAESGFAERAGRNGSLVQEASTAFPVGEWRLEEGRTGMRWHEGMGRAQQAERQRHKRQPCPRHCGAAGTSIEKFKEGWETCFSFFSMQDSNFNAKRFRTYWF